MSASATESDEPSASVESAETTTMPPPPRVDLHTSPIAPVIVDAAHAAIARATAREVAVHEAYERARNILRARNRRRALVQPTREMFSTPGRLDVHAGRSLPSYAWGVPVSRRGQLIAVICPTASAITAQIRTALARTLIVVASHDEQERIRRTCEPGQRFVMISARVPEPAHEEIVEVARRTPVSAATPPRI